jgi:hypothetical protein
VINFWPLCHIQEVFKNEEKRKTNDYYYFFFKERGMRLESEDAAVGVEKWT